LFRLSTALVVLVVGCSLVSRLAFASTDSVDRPLPDIQFPRDGSTVILDRPVTVRGQAGHASALEVYDGYRGTGRLLAHLAVEAAEFAVEIAPEQLSPGSHTISLYRQSGPAGWTWARSIAIETAAPRCDEASDPLPVTGWSVGPDGRASVSGQITNRCRMPMAVEVNVPFTDADGRPVAVSDAVVIDEVEPNQTVTWRASVAGLRADESYQARPRAAWYTSEPSCVDVAQWAPCLETTGKLVAAVNQLRQMSAGQRLLAAAATGGIGIERGPTPPGAHALFRAATRSIIVSPSLDTASDVERAAVIAHELQHASDFSTHRPIATGDGCFAAELAAFTTQASIWRELWQGRLPRPQTALQTELNDVARDPVRFLAGLQPVYDAQCSGGS
jgi:hypothetical protein